MPEREQNPVKFVAFSGLVFIKKRKPLPTVFLNFIFSFLLSENTFFLKIAKKLPTSIFEPWSLMSESTTLPAVQNTYVGQSLYGWSSNLTV